MSTKIVAFVALAAIALAVSPTASAHVSGHSADGKIEVRWGWTDEPATTLAKNGLDLVIRDNATKAGIGGLQDLDDLEVALHYGEEELEIDLTTPFGRGPGNYTASEAITPSRAGIYVLHVSGTINGSAIDVEIAANHEVHDIADTFFPEAEGLDARLAALEDEVAALKAKQQTQSTVPATVTSQPTGGAIPAPAAIGILGVLAAAAIVLARRK